MASSIELDPITNENETNTKQLISPSVAAKIPPLSLNSDSSHQMCQKILSKLLAHAGFEGAKSNALNVLSDIMTDYISNIAKTLKCYWDDYGHRMNGDVMCGYQYSLQYDTKHMVSNIRK